MDDSEYVAGTIKCDGCFRYYPEASFAHDCREGRALQLMFCTRCGYTTVVFADDQERESAEMQRWVPVGMCTQGQHDMQPWTAAAEQSSCLSCPTCGRLAKRQKGAFFHRCTDGKDVLCVSHCDTCHRAYTLYNGEGERACPHCT